MIHKVTTMVANKQKNSCEKTWSTIKNDHGGATRQPNRFHEGDFDVEDESDDYQ